MKKHFIIIIFIHFILLLSGCKEDKSNQGTDVKEDFTAFKQALLTGNGELAVEFMTDETISWYDEIRQFALNSSNVDFENLSAIQVTSIFIIRYNYKKSELENMDGKQLLISCIQKGLVGKESIKKSEIKSVQYEGDVAFASIIKEEKQSGEIYLKFHKKNNRWQIDMINILEQANLIFEKIIKESNKSKIEFAVYVLEKTYNKEIPPSILNGPLE